MKILISFLLFLILSWFFAASSAFATAANLSCSPSTGTYNVGNTFTVDYVLDTRTFAAYGADVVATYDPSIIEVVDTTSTAITTATGWGQPSVNTIDNSLGKIDFKYGSSQPVFTGNATIGQVTFRAKTAGQAQFNYTFFQQDDDTTPGVAKVWGKKDGTNLSNILTDVNNCIFIVEGAGITPTAAPGLPTATPPPILPSPTIIPTLPIGNVSEIPRAGKMADTYTFLTLGGLFFTLGLIHFRATFS